MSSTSLRKRVILAGAVLGFASLGFGQEAHFMGVGYLPASPGLQFSRAYGVSGDGTVVVGESYSVAGLEAFRWQLIGTNGVIAGLGDLPGGSFSSSARATSADGSVVVGRSRSASGFEAFRWESGVMTGLGDLPGGFFSGYAYGVSADGSVVVGRSHVSPDYEAFVWSPALGSGMVGLGDLDGGNFASDARAVSADGRFAVGQGASALGLEAAMWDVSGLPAVVTGLGDLPGGTFDSKAYGVSADGLVVVGYGTSALGQQAFRWTRQRGMVGLGDLPGGAYSSAARAVSADGTIVVGSGETALGPRAFIWDARSRQLRNLQEEMVSLYGLDLTGWTLERAEALSADGLTVAGYGRDPQGTTQGWMAYLWVDTDGDGVPNLHDLCEGFDDGLDADGDGMPDGCDVCPGFDDYLDCNTNGVPDACDVAGGTSPDCNANGVPDACDITGGCLGDLDIDGSSTNTWNYPLSTYYHDARTTSIYLASEFGCPGGTITALRYYVTDLPGQAMSFFTIRMRHTTATSYTSGTFENAGWTVVYQGMELISTLGWYTISLSGPFAWNGIDNLEVDVTFNNNFYTNDGWVYVFPTAYLRSRYYRCDSCSCGTYDPLTWTCSGSLTSYVPRAVFVMGGASWDCNGNRVPDECDLAAGTSRDCNSSGKPDECELAEDCNSNAVPDECDLAGGTSRDCDANEIPDECQGGGDCNANGQPDFCDILAGTSGDCHLDGIPDECVSFADCNSNAVPDECEMRAQSSMLYAVEAGWDGPTGLFQINPTNAAATLIGYLDQGIRNAAGLAIQPVSERMYAVVEYDPWSGQPRYLAAVDKATAAVTIIGPLTRFLSDIAFHPDGTLYGCTGNADYAPGEIVRVNTADASIVSTGLVLGGGQSITFDPRTGMLYHTYRPILERVNLTTGEVTRITSSLSYHFNAITFDIYSGHLLAFTWGDLYDIDPASGQLSYLGDAPETMTGMAFGVRVLDCNSDGVLDSCAQDCNGNRTPDDCDLAAGTSADTDANDVPDECQVDCNSDGVWDYWDILAGTSRDCNDNVVPDECDLASGASGDCNGDGTLDECEIASGSSRDCNANGVPDACDLAAGTSADCNSNGTLDECEATTLGPLYGVEPGWGSSPRLFRVDPATGPGVVVGYLNQGVTNAAGLAADPRTGTLYAIVQDQDPWNSGRLLARVNRATAEVEKIGPLSRYLSDIAFRGDGTLFGVAGNNDPQPGEIVIVDTSDASITAPGIFGSLGGAQSIAFKPGTNLLYHTSRPGNYQLEVIDVLTGAVTVVAPQMSYYYQAITFDPVTGQLLGSYWDDWIIIDPTTGAETFVLDSNIDLSGLAFALVSHDCDDDGTLDECEPDCNRNGLPDDCDLYFGASVDADSNGVPDECETDCNSNGFADIFDIAAGTSADCQPNGIPDECEIATGSSTDLDNNGVPDECQPDCNTNGIPDNLDIAAGTSGDCQPNGIPDECEIGGQEVRLYSVERDSPALYTVNPTNGALTVVGNMDQGVFGARGLSAHPATQELYALVDVGTIGLPSLASVDRETAAVSVIGTVSQSLEDIAFRSNGTLYGITRNDAANPGEIMIVDLGNAGLTSTGIVRGSGVGQSLAFQPGTDRLYHAYNVYGGPEKSREGHRVKDAPDLPRGSGSILETIDVDSGDVVQLNFSLNADVYDSLAFDPSGAPLLGFSAGNLYGIDPVTGLDTPLASGVTTITGMAFVSVFVGEADCNTNGIPDNCEPDCNSNGVPDDCDLATGCSGDVDIDGMSTGTWNYPLSTYYHDARTTSIYLASEFGCPGGQVKGMRYYVARIPGQPMLEFTIRLRHTLTAAYTDGTFDNLGWTVVYQGTEVITSSGWHTFTFREPFAWNGHDHLEVDVSFNNGAFTSDGEVYAFSAPATRTKCYRCDSCTCGTNNPLTWTCVGDLTTDVPRAVFVMGGFSEDCNQNGTPDECDAAGAPQIDCNTNGILDECEDFTDCNSNGKPDACDIGAGTSRDCDGNREPDECQGTADCNSNGAPDLCDIMAGTSGDCQFDGVPDECVAFADCNLNAIPDVCETTAPGEELYGIEAGWGDPPRLFRVDPLAASLALIGYLDGGVNNAVGLAIHPRTGQMYAVVEFTPWEGQPRWLAEVDKTTAAVTIMGELSRFLSDIAFHPGGALYGCTGQGDPVPGELVVVDPADASVTTTGRVLSGGQSIAFDPDTGDLYHTYYGLLERIDLRNGQTTMVNPNLNYMFNALTFDAAGHRLLACSWGELYAIHPETGAAQLLGDTGETLTGLTFGVRVLDCNTNGILDACETDCNTNGVPDDCDIAAGTSPDVNQDGTPDDCLARDCNHNGVADDADLAGGTSPDCNSNGVPDECDLAGGTSADCNTNAIPDECDIASGVSEDVNQNGISDECEADCNTNGVPDDADIGGGASRDCNDNGVPDECDLAATTSADCNSNAIPDECDLSVGTGADCNSNAVPDFCDLASGTSQDINHNSIPDECEPDCNTNGIPDDADIGGGTTGDCNSNGVPDECELAGGTSLDCNTNALPDECDLASGSSHDANDNGIPDECEVDCNGNGVPDDADISSGTSRDCNGNTVPDECDLASAISADCNSNAIPDECDIAAGSSYDCQPDGVPDECGAALCDDSSVCTTNDVCSHGWCVGTPVNCDDGNPCTDDSCDAVQGCQHPTSTRPCDDGNACTTADTCEGGECLGGPAMDCDDGEVCSTDSCDPQSGCVHAWNADLSLNVAPGSECGGVGDTVTVMLDVACLPAGINGAQALIGYDSSMLTLLSISPASPWSETSEEDLNGDVTWAAVIQDGQMTEDGTLAALVFTTVAEGPVSLGFRADGPTEKTQLTLWSDGSVILPDKFASGDMVIDGTVPVVSVEAFTPDPAKSGTYPATVHAADANLDDPVSWTITVTDGGGNTNTIAHTVPVHQSGDTYTFQLTIPSGMAETVDGLASIAVAVGDCAGHVQSPPATPFHVDTQPPVLSGVSVTQDGQVVAAGNEAYRTTLADSCAPGGARSLPVLLAFNVSDPERNGYASDLAGDPAVVVTDAASQPIAGSLSGGYVYTLTLDGTTANGLASYTVNVNDLAGNVASGVGGTFPVNVTQVVAGVDLQGVSHAVEREVEFVLTDCDGAPDMQTWTRTLCTDATGLGTTTLVRVDYTRMWEALTAREGHTLRQLLETVTFTDQSASAVFMGVNQLRAGDFHTAMVPQDNQVDIMDFSILASRWNTPVGDCDAGVLPANCGMGADVTGDGAQATADFTAIQINFFGVGEAPNDCPREAAVGEAGFAVGRRGRVAVTELEALIPSAGHADVTGDGVIDVRDIRALARRHHLTLLPEFEAKLSALEVEAQVTPVGRP